MEPSNYRPISLLSNLEKILEKLMYSRLVSFLDRFEIIYSKQFGFRKKHSTSDIVNIIVERIRKALDDGQYACGVFVDLQKAFDTVDHEILLQKLKHYGIRNTALSWFKTYLSGRFQFVSVSDVKSCLKAIKHGVPQGSVLGPLLFLIFINDLHHAVRFSETFQFADDTNLLHFGKSSESLNNEVNQDLGLLYDWLIANKIALNTDKTKFILFKSKRKPQIINFELSLPGGEKIQPSTHIKYLGVILDENLSWQSHIQSLSQKLRRANGALSKLRHYVPNSVLINIYHALFSSHMRYNCQAFGLANNYLSNRIFILQKAAVRIMTFSPFRTHSSPLFARLKILTIFDLVKTLNVLFIHRVLNNNVPYEVRDNFKFTIKHHAHNTRESTAGCLEIPNVNTNSFGIFSLSYQSISTWNSLSRIYVNSTDTQFANRKYSDLKRLIIAHYSKNPLGGTFFLLADNYGRLQ